jgi:hypothetical protein
MKVWLTKNELRNFLFHSWSIYCIGRKDYSAMLRHMDVACCVIGWTALYLFARWQSSQTRVETEGFPDLSASANWFNVKVIYIFILE